MQDSAKCSQSEKMNNVDNPVSRPAGSRTKCTLRGSRRGRDASATVLFSDVTGW